MQSLRRKSERGSWFRISTNNGGGHPRAPTAIFTLLLRVTIHNPEKPCCPPECANFETLDSSQVATILARFEAAEIARFINEVGLIIITEVLRSVADDPWHPRGFYNRSMSEGNQEVMTRNNFTSGKTSK